jgi:hypothetical protein
MYGGVPPYAETIGYVTVGQAPDAHDRQRGDDRGGMRALSS